MSDSSATRGVTKAVVGWPVFTNWINGHLAGRQVQIFNIRTDLSNGVYLGILLGYFRGKELKGLSTSPATSDEAAQNLRYVLSEFSKEDPYIQRVANFEGIFSYDIKAILPFVAAVMHRFSGYPLPLAKHREDPDPVVARQNGIPLECLEKPPNLSDDTSSSRGKKPGYVMPQKRAAKVVMFSSYAPGSLIADTNIRRMKFLLEAKGAQFEVIDLMENPKMKKEIMRLCNTLAVPQLVVDDIHIGDLERVQILEDAGELADILFPIFYPEEPVAPQDISLKMEGKPIEGCYLVIRVEGNVDGLRTEWQKQGINSPNKETILDSKERSYQIRTSDVGYYVVCNCWSGTRLLATFTTESLVVAGPPRIVDLCYKAGPFYTHGISVSAQYSGGQLGYYIYQWYRRSGSGVVTPIIGANNPTYYPHFNDIEHKAELCVDVVPVRGDGVMGVSCRMTIPTSSLSMDPTMKAMVDEWVARDELAIDVRVENHKDPTQWQLVANPRKLKIKHKKKTMSKLKWASPQLWYDLFDEIDNRRLTLKFENEAYQLLFESSVVRDACVLALRSISDAAQTRTRRSKSESRPSS